MEENKTNFDYNSPITIIPVSTYSDNSFKDFFKICKAYYKEIKDLKTHQMISKNDCIILNDLIRELNHFIPNLIIQSFIEEAKKLLKIGIKIVDYLLKIFSDKSVQNNIKNQNSPFILNTNNSPLTNFKLVFPFTLKLQLLQNKFHINFNLENNYDEAEYIINEIIKIQNFLQLPNFNLGCSSFYLAIIKFLTNNINEAESLANESLKYFEIKFNNKELSVEKIIKISENFEENNFNENKTIRKISSVLEFLAEIYDLKKDFKNVLRCYERAYNLNLARYGANNVNTEYFKIKIEIFYEKNKNENRIYNLFTNNNLISEAQISNSHSNKIDNTFAFIQNKYNLSIENSKNYSLVTQKSEFKGNSETFKFIINKSNLYEPLVISIFDLCNDKENSDDNIFITNLYFDKNQLFKFFRIKNTTNSELYIENNLLR